ncbi:MAG TPA: hypothetical protein PLV84_10305 [Deltaproteobacteria bacterium]|nr:hypothetical protein [Deltaproteobacteria bacterium]
MRFRHTRVKTFDSSRHPGQPVWFEYNGKGLEIEDVLERWSEAYQDPSFFPDEYYRVEASDRHVYLLRYSTLFKSWWVKEFEGVAA